MKRPTLGYRTFLVVTAMFTACSSSGAESLGQIESALTCNVTNDCADGSVIQCSSASGTCDSGPDNNGWVECDGVRTFCPPPAPVCTCGTQRFTVTRTGQASGCGAATVAARNAIAASMQQQCPSGSCNAVEMLGECTPVGSNRTSGFRMTVSNTFSCNEPIGCQ